jgi:predicted ATP-grasp superfamily ATP-dependent carboligase
VREPAALLRCLRDAAAGHDRPVLLWSAEEFAVFCAEQRDGLRGAFRFAAPPEELTTLLFDKRRQYEAAERAGIPVPATRYPRGLDELAEAAASLRFPVFVKPLLPHLWRSRHGSGAKGHLALGPDELARGFEAVMRGGGGALVQSYVAGPCSGQVEVSAYLDARGEPLATFAARRLRQHPPTFGNATLLESVEHPAAVALALRFLRHVRYRGFACVELKEDERSGALTFIELNPELQNGLPIDCGVDFPRVEYLDVLGERPRAGGRYVVGRRWWSLPSDLKALAAGGEAPLRWAAQCARARSFATFAADDPAPFVRSYGGRLAAALARRARRALSRA